eukprot:1778557-Pyramimonas_sp.AAC.3
MRAAIGCFTALHGLFVPRISRASSAAEANTGRETDRCHQTDTNVFTAATVRCTRGSLVHDELKSSEKPRDEPGWSGPWLRAAATRSPRKAELLLSLIHI